MKLSRTGRAGVAALLLSCTLAAQAGPATPGDSLTALLELARAANPDLAAMRLEANAAQERTEMAGALMDPKLTLERMSAVELMPEARSVRMNRIQLMQDLPWPGKRDLKREVALHATDAAAAQALAAWTELAARIKATYAELDFVFRNEREAQRVYDLMVDLERLALARYTGGLAPQQDVIRAQVEQTAMKSELLMIARERRMLQARMNMLLGRRADEPLAAPGQPRPLPDAAGLDAAQLGARARAGNPGISASDAQVRAARSNNELTLRNRYPDFSVAVRGSELSLGKLEWMVQINLPLQQSSRRAAERESEAMLAAALSRREANANQVDADLAENLAAFEWAQRNEVLIASTLLPQAELSLTSALAGYENGRVDFATLLEAQRQVRQARQRQLRARADAQMRLAEIERLVGEDLQ